MPKYPNVRIQLVGEDGNAFSILGRVSTAMRRAGLGKDEIDAFRAEATSGDYGHLLMTVMDWVSCDDDDEDEDDEDVCWYCEQSEYECECDEYEPSVFA